MSKIDVSEAARRLYQASVGGVSRQALTGETITGKFSAIQFDGDGGTFSTTGLTDNFSGWAVGSMGVVIFGDERAVTITANTGNLRAFDHSQP